MSNHIPSKLLVIRSTVTAKSDYSEYKEELRSDFCYACAYCGMTEAEARAVGYQIDHYSPFSKFPALKNNYDNLMWSCELCNRRKTGFYPNDVQRARGYYILKIDVEDPRPHYEMQDLRIEGTTDTGTFNIARLDLNRQSLRKIREIRRDNYNADQYLIHGLREIMSIGIDNIPPENRIRFENARKQTLLNYEKVAATTSSLFCDLSRSPLLDEDSDYKERTKELRKYLKTISAIGQDSQLPDFNKVDPRKKKSKKNKK